MEPLIGAIVGGNTAIVKPSETSVHTAVIVKKSLRKHSRLHMYVSWKAKGRGYGSYSCFLRLYLFTGSVAVGKVVAKSRRTFDTSCVRACGKSPAIVDQTANLEVALKRIVWSKFTNTGQTCVALIICLYTKTFMTVL